MRCIALLGLLTASLATAELQPGWNVLPASADPGERLDATLTLDAETQRIFLFGGESSHTQDGKLISQRLFNDLWAWDLEHGGWTKMAANGPRPTVRVRQAMCWDAGRHGMWLFGGSTTNGTTDDLWFYDARQDAWKEIEQPTSRPEHREAHILVHDPRLDRLILIGGMANEVEKRAIADVWAWSCVNKTWTRLNPPNDGPGPRYAAGYWYDPAHRRVLSSGGFLSGGKAAPSFLWAFDLASLSWMAQPMWPSEATGISLTPIAGERLLALGGFSERIIDKRGAWSQRPLINLPPRQHHAACSDLHGRVWVYGGTVKEANDASVPAGLWVRNVP